MMGSSTARYESRPNCMVRSASSPSIPITNPPMSMTGVVVRLRYARALRRYPADKRTRFWSRY
ncbi:MAG: hypothetical protein QOD01_2349 [Actinomycetota bacterium]|nr:hypothetical protein [Actinomycetota bacterium]